jgi:hypothetical protein
MGAKIDNLSISVAVAMEANNDTNEARFTRIEEDVVILKHKIT